MLTLFLFALLISVQSHAEYYEATTHLNIRELPGLDEAIIVDPPVPPGFVMRYEDDEEWNDGYLWYKVSAELFGIGWAASAYLRPHRPSGVKSKKCHDLSWPHYSQCDSRWGTKLMGGGGTICQYGSLISSFAMILTGLDRKLRLNGNLKTANPRVVHRYLKLNDLYDGNNIADWDWAKDETGLTYVMRSSSKKQIARYLCSDDHVVILSVDNGEHWIAAEGSYQGGYHVQDSGIWKHDYVDERVVEGIIFSI